MNPRLKFVQPCALPAHCLGLSSATGSLQVARATEAENFSKKELVRLGEELEESKVQRVSGTQGTMCVGAGGANPWWQKRDLNY